MNTLSIGYDFQLSYRAKYADIKLVGWLVNEMKKCQWLHGSSVNNLHAASHCDRLVAFMWSGIHFLNIFRVNQPKLFKTKLAN